MELKFGDIKKMDYDDRLPFEFVLVDLLYKKLIDVNQVKENKGMTKAFTDIEQSKKLAEILPIESADMRYHTISHYNPYPCDEMVYTMEFGKASGVDIPCWSLAALLGVLQEVDDNIEFWSDHEDWYLTVATLNDVYSSSLVDACYEMILKLHELKML